MDVLVLVPTYNERENLAVLAPRVLAHSGYRMLVIDDASPDGTGELADDLSRQWNGRLHVLHRSKKEGLGRAYVAGMRKALGEHPGLICQMDADGSHDADDLPRLVSAARDCDLVIGSRYVDGGALSGWSRYRMALSRLGNAYVRAVIGLRVRDCTAGMRCWRPETLVRLSLDRVQSNGYAFQVETLYRTILNGGRVCEVPITFTDRTRGTSKLSGGVVLEGLALPWRIRSGVLAAKPAVGVGRPGDQPIEQDAASRAAASKRA
jgi:glycosyltransferase involved in cell wall biosynthesis